MKAMQARGLTCLGRMGLCAVLATPLLPATANAADTIYWASESAGAVQFGNLDGSGSAQNLFGSEGAPCGVAIDSAAGKIYWANFNGDEIRVGNLDGMGTPTTLISGEDGACGVAVDPAAGRIYWASYFGGTIRGADLTSSVTLANAATLVSTTPNGPSGVAIDAGKIYWTNQASGTLNGEVARANLDGTVVEHLVINQANPIGIAVDAAAGKIYWANLNDGTNTGCCSGPGAIRRANLDGTSPETLVNQLNAGPLGVAGPAGVSIDAAAGKIYWANFGGDSIWSASLDGAGPTQLFGLGGSNGANFPVLLRAPVPVGRPAISGGAKVGRDLTCREGTWAPDLLGAFLFRSPAAFAFQWNKDGSPIAGATSATFTPTENGDYTCTVTATNQAGATSQTSAVKKVKESKGKGKGKGKGP